MVSRIDAVMGWVVGWALAHRVELLLVVLGVVVLLYRGEYIERKHYQRCFRDLLRQEPLVIKLCQEVAKLRRKLAEREIVGNEDG